MSSSALTDDTDDLIAFSSDQDGDFEIWVMNTDGSDQRKLTDNDTTDWSPAWSPDGNQIVFISNRDSNDEIYVMNPDGSDVRRLTQTNDASESFPAWSPDGLQISFDSDRGGNWDVYIMTFEGADVRQLTDHSADDWISSWSPDSNRIVFESKRDGNYEIYVMNADGSGQKRLTQNADHDGFPSWSPDGLKIAFLSRQAGNYDVYAMDPDGGNVVRLTDDPAEDSSPSWSPDGAQIVFSSQRDGNDEIFTMNADGSNVRQLTKNGAQNWDPSWPAALNQEAGLPIPAPVPTPGGRLQATIVTPGMPHGRVVSLMRWLDGQKLQQGLRPQHLKALGHVVAQLHVFSANWQSPAGFTRPHWDWDSQLGGNMFELSLEELVASMPAQFQEPFQTVSQKAKRAMELLGKGPDAYGLIHADLYPENVLFKDGKAYPIDFEDCGYGYWMWDIAVALCRWALGEDWERMRDAFHEGYAQVRTLPEAQWAQLDLFVATQFATMVLWSSAFLKHDPMRVAEYEPWRNDNGNKLLSYFQYK